MEGLRVEEGGTYRVDGGCWRVKVRGNESSRGTGFEGGGSEGLRV